MFPKCGHTFCVKCIKGYIRAMLEAEAETIPCPQANCKETITNMNYLDLSSEDNIEANQNNGNDYYNGGQRNIIHCPTPNCTYNFEWKGGSRENERFECLKCRIVICANCLVPWHANKTCREYMSQNNDVNFQDDELFDLDHKIDRICPRCSVQVQSEIGVDKMSCTKCKYDFCPKCLSKYGCCMCRFTTSYKPKQGQGFGSAPQEQVNRKMTDVDREYDYEG